MNELNRAYLASADMNTGVYGSGGGGGGDSGSSDAGPDFNGMMAGLMAQLVPQDEQVPPPGFSAADVAQMRRPQTQVSEDRTLSIFARISYRYFYVGKRVLFSQQNPRVQTPRRPQ